MRLGSQVYDRNATEFGVLLRACSKRLRRRTNERNEFPPLLSSPDRRQCARNISGLVANDRMSCAAMARRRLGPHCKLLATVNAALFPDADLKPRQNSACEPRASRSRFARLLPSSTFQ
jgi:hypothetical protein